MSRAIQAAREKIRAAVPSGLPIHQAALDHGESIGAVARGVRGRPRRVVADRRSNADVSGEWWHK